VSVRAWPTIRGLNSSIDWYALSVTRGIALLALLTGLLIGCGDGTCPCGALPSDPFSLHDPTYDGPHRVVSETECEHCDSDAGFE